MEIKIKIMEISVNGVKYKLRPTKKNTKMGNIALALGLGLSSSMSKQDINIVEEYKLIQDKKSQLSRSLRDWVVYQFNQMYEIVE